MHTDKTPTTWMALMQPSVLIGVYPWFNLLRIDRGDSVTKPSVFIRVHPWFKFKPPVVRRALQ